MVNLVSCIHFHLYETLNDAFELKCNFSGLHPGLHVHVDPCWSILKGFKLFSQIHRLN